MTRHTACLAGVDHFASRFDSWGFRMSRFPLRDVADRLTTAPDLDAAVDALLGYLHAVQPDWHPSFAVHDAGAEAISHVYRRTHGQLERRDVRISIDQLPARIVRKYFRPSAFFQPDDRRQLLEKLFQTSPAYEPERFEAPQLTPMLSPVAWQSCVCLPLADRDDLLGMLFVVSPRVRAFSGNVLDDLLALRSLAALSFARRLQSGGRLTPEARQAEEQMRQASQVSEERMLELQQQYEQLSAEHHESKVAQERLRELQRQCEQLATDCREKGETITKLNHETELLRVATKRYLAERSEIKDMLAALEDQNASAGLHLADAYAELAATQARHSEAQRTLDFLREGFEVIARMRNAKDSTKRIVQWFCEQFQVERCSLMRMDDRAGSLRILEQLGMDPAVAGRVDIPLGQGVSGWVARHRKPLFVREDLDVTPAQPRGGEGYNSGSFISVPLLHRDRIVGVLNLSNKRDGEPFDETDLERAQLAGALLALTLGGPEQAPVAGRVTVAA